MITILTPFTGHPDPDGKGVHFRAGQTVDGTELPKEFVDMIVTKGLAVRKAPEKTK